MIGNWQEEGKSRSPLLRKKPNSDAFLREVQSLVRIDARKPEKPKSVPGFEPQPLKVRSPLLKCLCHHCTPVLKTSLPHYLAAAVVMLQGAIE